MEAINEFYIDLDLSGVTRIYDYEHGKHLMPGPDGQWDQAGLRQRLPVESVEDCTKYWLMDRAFTAKGCLETDSRDTKSKCKTRDADDNIFNRTCESELPYRLLPEIKPGGVVKGNVILVLNEEVETEKLTISFKGGARVQIRVYHQHGKLGFQTPVV